MDLRQRRPSYDYKSSILAARRDYDGDDCRSVQFDGSIQFVDSI